MFVKKAGDGCYYIFRVPPGGGKCHSKGSRTISRNNFLCKTQIDMNAVNLPKELWGKRIRFKVEVI